MKSKIRKVLHIKFIKYFIVPLILLGLWSGLTLLAMISYDKNFLGLSQNHDATNFIQKPTGELLEGQKLRGQFVASENNLGIVSIRFKQKLRTPYKDEDQLIFRIKEKGAQQWHYEGKYMSGLTFDVPFLPFGFPLIPDSRWKTYEFELESTQGNKKNGVVLSERMPNLASMYQISRAELLNDKPMLVMFAVKKLLSALQTIDIIFFSFVSSIPLLLYISLLVFRRNSIYALYFKIIIILIILYDIISLQISNDYIYIITSALWVILLKIQEKSSFYTFIFGVILITFTPILYQFDNVSAALKSNSWGYVILFTGTLQLLLSQTKNSNKILKKKKRD